MILNCKGIGSGDEKGSASETGNENDSGMGLNTIRRNKVTREDPYLTMPTHCHMLAGLIVGRMQTRMAPRHSHFIAAL